MEEKIATKCGQCGKEFMVPATLAGKKARCKCGNIVIVPAVTAAAEPKPPAERKWYYAKGRQRSGPVSTAEIIELRSKGEIGDEDLVWSKGMNSWQTADSVAQINAGVAKKEETASEEPDEPQAPAAAAQEVAAPEEPAEEDTDARQWYYAVSGRQQGPLGTAEVRDMARSGGITASSLLWTEGMANWTKAADVEDLRELFRTAASAETRPEEKPAEPAEKTAAPEAAKQVEAEQPAQAGEPAQAPDETPAKTPDPVAAAPRKCARNIARLSVAVGALTAVCAIAFAVFSLVAAPAAVHTAGTVAGSVIGGLWGLTFMLGLSEILKLLAGFAEKK